MIWPAVLSGATTRVLRGVAGRRALHVALLVGGVFVLGLLCGERAQAAESAPQAASSATGPAARTTGTASSAEPEQSPGAASDPAAHNDVRQVGERVGEQVGRAAEGLAGDLADGLREASGRLGDGLGESLGDVRDGVPPNAALPALPPSAALPSPPRPLPAPVTAAPQPGPADEAPAAGRDAGPATGTARDTEAGREHPGASAHASPLRAYDHGSAPAGQPVMPASPQQPPGGEPDGVLGKGAAGDGSGSRYGDAHAVTPAHREPAGLVPGAAARVDAAGTRDRHRDIPVSPA